jgi:hypothetical protein
MSFEIEFCLAVRFVCILHEYYTQRDDSEQVCCCWPIIYVSNVTLENLALSSVSHMQLYKQNIY